MFEYYLAGFSVRATQVLVDSAVWIAFGLFIAAIMRMMLGPEKIRQIFVSDKPYGILVGWAVGMLLPVCSLGAIPVVRELHRAGVRGGTIIAFGLTAPLFNPLSILYGLTLSDPIALLVFTLGALVIVTLLGLVWDRFHLAQDSPAATENIPAGGVQRSAAVLYSAMTDLAGWTLFFILVGVVGSTLVSTITPHGSMQTQAEPDKVFAPVVMAGFVTPVYATPLQVMSQIGGMFQHGNSVGAAFSLLILGAGTNLGLLLAFGSMLGIKRTMIFMVMLWSVTIAIAYGIDKPLYPSGVSPSGHTHAFDVYTHPYSSQHDGLLEKAGEDIADYRAGRDFGGTYLLLGMLVLGIALRVLNRFLSLESWFHRSAPGKSRLETSLAPAVIGVVACLGLVALSIVGTYLYYPPTDELLADLFTINTNCVIAGKTGDWEGVSKWVVYCDDLSRRLEVSKFLREGGASEFQSAKAEVYRDKLDTLRDAIEAGQTGSATEMAQDVARAYMQLSKAFK